MEFYFCIPNMEYTDWNYGLIVNFKFFNIICRGT